MSSRCWAGAGLGWAGLGWAGLGWAGLGPGKCSQARNYRRQPQPSSTEELLRQKYKL